MRVVPPPHPKKWEPSFQATRFRVWLYGNVGVILAQWKRKWKLLYYRDYVGVWV